MSEPTTFEFAAIEVRTATTPSDTWVRICGIQTTGFNRTKQTNDRYVRDCQAPAKTPERKVRVTGKSRTVTGSGLANADQIDLINQLEDGTWQVRYIIMDVSDPSVEAGTEIGTWEGPGVFTSINMGTSENDDATIELTLESDGVWAYTPAAEV